MTLDMNWDAIIAITEIVGVIAVIASLIYVAVQIKQNSSIARAHIVHDTSESYTKFFELLANDGELADIFRRATDGENLHETEIIRYSALLDVYFANLEDVDHQYKNDLYFVEDDDEDIVSFMAPQFRPFLDCPVGRLWWSNSGQYSSTPSFSGKINKIIDEWDERKIPTLQPESDAVAKNDEPAD